jgi:Tfp pilus assembly protein FimT
MTIIATTALEARRLARSQDSGYSLIDLLFTLGLLAVLGAATVPQAIASFERPRTHAAARYLASRLSRAHTQAVMRTATIGVRFTPGPDGVLVEEFIDANRNGIRTAEIQSGVDRAVGEPARLSDLFPRVTIELSAQALMSFTPYGTATSRTIYLRGADGSRFGVRVLGASGRTRLIRFDPPTGDWVDVL